MSLLLTPVTAYPTKTGPLSLAALSIGTVTPAEAYNYESAVITITGADFVTTPTVFLNSTPLPDVGFVDSETLTATVPADLPGGVYTVTVTNPDTESASLPDAFEVLPRGDGMTGVWQLESTLNLGRSDLSVTQAAGHVYAIAGYDHSQCCDATMGTVESAAIGADGALGAWQTLSNTLNTVRYGAAAITVGNSIYVIGGDNRGYLNSVEQTTVAPNGDLSLWQTLTATLNIRRMTTAAVQANGFLYVIGGFGTNSCCNSTNTIERAFIQPDGTLSAWEVLTATLSVGRHRHGAVYVGGYIYVVAGDTGGYSNHAGSVERAAVYPDGSLSAWQSFPRSLNYPRTNAPVAYANGYIYLMGGIHPGGSSLLSARVERLPIHADGTVGNWELLPAQLGNARMAAGVAQLGDYLYLVGGDKYFEWDSDLASVERTNLNPLAISVVPEDVAGGQAIPFTISGANFLPVTSVSLNSTPIAANFVSSHTLTITVPANLPGGAYTATLTNPSGQMVFSPDALFVDNLPPVGAINLNSGASHAAATAVMLTISATDNRSLAEMAFSDDGFTFTPNEPYQTTRAWNLPSGDGTKVVYSRFTDAVGNVSAPVSDTIILDQTPPSGSVEINVGALATTSVDVILNLAASTTNPASQLSHMSFSTDGSSFGSWLPYATFANWVVESGDGPKTVYARFRDGVFNVSEVVTAAITLDTSAEPEYQLSINEGALYTNQISVTLTVGAPPGTAQMRVSNDGGFADSDWEPYDVHRAWTITQYGTYVIPRTVYVRYRDWTGAISAIYQDDIILDVTPPTGAVEVVPEAVRIAAVPPAWLVSAVAVHKVFVPMMVCQAPQCGMPVAVTVILDASDDVSGVGDMMLSNDASFAGAVWEPFSAEKSWQVAASGTTTIRVKFRDHAGNVSSVYSIAYSP